MANQSRKYPRQMSGGMDRTVDNSLVPPQRWRTLFNMRPRFGKLTQVERKRLFGFLCGDDQSPITALVTVPTGNFDVARVVALSGRRAYAIGRRRAFWLQDSEAFDTNFVWKEGVDARWSTTMYKNKLYFVNPLNRVHETDGTVVNKLSSAPTGSYVEHFYDHLVVGRANGEAGLVKWSHLHRFGEWESKTFTEADERHPAEHAGGSEAVLGITGLGRLGDTLFVYTPSAIYGMSYAGVAQGGFRTDPVILDAGCGMPHGLVRAGGAHFFPDLNRKTFFKFDGQQLTDIGAPIMEYVFDTLNRSSVVSMRMWGYADMQKREVRWVFTSRTKQEEFDRHVTVNIDSGEWYTGSVEDFSSFVQDVRSPLLVQELEGQAGSLTGVVNRLSTTGFTVPRLYGGKGILLTDELPDDTAANVLHQEVPYMETGDMVYQGPWTVSEIDKMWIQAKQVLGSGVKVYCSSRAQHDETVSWTLLGTWTADRLTFARQSGRILRFLFIPVEASAASRAEIRRTEQCVACTECSASGGSTDDWFIRERKVSFRYICDAFEDKAGYWGQFEPAYKQDYKWEFDFTLPADRVLKYADILRLTADGDWRGQAWATKFLTKPPGYGGETFATFPIVVFENGEQLNTKYRDSWGTLTAGEHQWTMYGDSFTAPDPTEYFMLRLYWADDPNNPEMLVAGAACLTDDDDINVFPPPDLPDADEPDDADECSGSTLAVACPANTSVISNSAGAPAPYTIPTITPTGGTGTKTLSVVDGSGRSYGDGDTVMLSETTVFTAVVVDDDGCVASCSWTVAFDTVPDIGSGCVGCLDDYVVRLYEANGTLISTHNVSRAGTGYPSGCQWDETNPPFNPTYPLQVWWNTSSLVWEINYTSSAEYIHRASVKWEHCPNGTWDRYSGGQYATVTAS